jgi:DNA repair exonuclease SbcCD ATPase subunit
MADYELKLGLNLQILQAKLAQVVPGIRDLAQNIEAAFNKALGAGTQGLEDWKNKLGELGGAVAAFSARWKSALASLSAAGAEDEAVDRRFTNIFGEADASASAFAETIGTKMNRAVADVKKGMLELKFTADQFGFTAAESAKLSQELTELGLRFAEFRGEDDAAVFAAIRQALIGNTRGLKQFGIAVDDATVKEKAFAMGLDPSKLSEQQQALVIVALLKERLGVASINAAKGEQTFTEASRGLHNQLGELAGEIGRIANEVIKPFVQWAADAVAGLRDWVKTNPALAQTLVTAGLAVGGLATAITAAVGAVNIGVAAFKAYQTALAAAVPIKAAFAAQTQALATMLPNMSGAMTVAGAAAATLGVAVGIAGAALAGWAIGRAIDDMVGFTDAAVKCAKGTATWTDELKNGLVNALVPFRAYIQAQDIAARKQAELEEEATGERLRETFDAKQLEVYNRYLDAGASKFKATMLAVNELNEMQHLHEQGEKRGYEQEKQLIELEARHQEEARALGKAEEDAAKAGMSAKEVRKLQADEEKSYLAAVEKTNLELIRARQGETAASLEEARREAEGRFKILTDAAKAQAAKIQELTEVHNRLQMSKLQSDVPAFQNVQRQLDTALAGYKTTQQAILNTEDQFRSALRQKVEDRVRELRQQGDQQVGDAKRVADETAKAYHNTLDVIEKDLDALRDRRAKGDADVAGLLKELETDELRRRSPILADIKNIEDRTTAILRSGGAEKDRQAVVEKTMAGLRATANLSQQIKDAETSLAEARERAIELQQRQGAKASEWNRVNDEIYKREQDLTKLRQQQSDAQAAIGQVQARLNAAAVAGGEEKKNVEFMINEAEQQRLYLLQQIETIEDGLAKKTQDINAGVQAQTANTKLFADQMERAAAATAAAAKISVGLQAPAQPQKPMTYEEQITAALAQSQDAAGAAADAKASATEAARAAAITATAATAANQASVNLGEGLSQAIATATGAVNSLTAQSAQLGTVRQLVPRMAESLTALVAEQKSYTEQMDNFAGVVLDKVGQTAAAFGKHAAVLADHAVRIAKIEIGGAADASLQAAGLAEG